MQNIYVLPEFATYLSFGLLYLSMVVYLLLWKPHTGASMWLCVSCAGFLLGLIGWSHWMLVPASFANQSIIPWASRMGYMGQFLQVSGLILFAYYYQTNLHKKETQTVIIVLSIMIIGTTYMHMVGSQLFFLGFTMITLLGPLWAMVVLFRKTARLSRLASESARSTFQHILHPGGKAARACRGYAGLAFTTFGVYVLTMLIYTVPNSLGIPLYILQGMALIVACWIFLGFTNDFSRKGTVQIKIVGTTLFVVLSVLGVSATALFSVEWSERQANLLALSDYTIQYKPSVDDQEAYTYQVLPLNWQEVDGGKSLALEDENDVVVEFPFAFPFYGDQWRDAHLNANGMLTFGGTVLDPNIASYKPWAFYDSYLPKIAFLYTDLDASRSQVQVVEDSSQFLISWENVSRFDSATPDNSDMQVVLYPDGTMTFSYRNVVTAGKDASGSALIGIHPGKTVTETAQIKFAADLSGIGQPMAAIVEDRFLQISQAVHPMGSRLIFVVLFSFFAILFGYPWLMNVSVLRPLKRLLSGVDEVKAGRLDVEVEKTSGDEIGQLTEQFNSMVASIKTANHELKNHADTLETRVAERTSELRESLENLQRAQQQLVQSEKMASLGQLTAGIAHEIKNPLNFVNNFSELSTEIISEIREEVEKFNGQLPVTFRQELETLLEDIQVHQEKINKHGRRADAIVQSMLAHSRNAPGELRAVDLNKFADEFIGLAYHGMRTTNGDLSVLIEREYDPCVGRVMVMPQGLGQVLVNLLNNALFAVLEKAKQMQADYRPTVTVSSCCIDGWVKLRVKDNGTGIPEGIRNRIFEPFFTTKPAGSGTGLGLSLSYEIITKAHGGKLEVESEEGEGTEFILSLPDK